MGGHAVTEDEAGMPPARPARDVMREVQLRLDAGGTAAERERYQFEHLSGAEADILLSRERHS